MIKFTTGNLLTANAEALVNTVNTVGIMGKGIALMFKETFPENFKIYEAACKSGGVKVGHMLVTERKLLGGPKWIINFPTKEHWRNPSKLTWIEDGLRDLVRVIEEKNIRSIALPPLGSGNGGLDWKEVRLKIESAFANVSDVEIIVYEPTSEYQNVAKRDGVEKLTAARALIAELVRWYWVLGFECSLLEIQKLAYFLEHSIEEKQLPNPLNLTFSANKYGPYSDKLKHLLNGLDGSYLHCKKRLADAGARDAIWFEESKKEKVAAFLTTPDVAQYRPALEATTELIDGFQSPLGLELLATVDWLLHHDGILPRVELLKEGLRKWPGGPEAAERKLRLFDDRLLAVAIERLSSLNEGESATA
jgi:O-acetyl-ADP-ribose deacetylase (regulator of RNase III)